MHNSGRMRRREGARNLDGDIDRLIQFQAALTDFLAQAWLRPRIHRQ